MKVRSPDFAGSWYPGSEAACLREIKGFMLEAVSPKTKTSCVGGIVPHAGWVFSGRIALEVFQALKEFAKPDVLILFGSHSQYSKPLIMKEGAFATPLGPIPVYSPLCEALTKEFDFEVETPEYHTPDNTIELQLPFIKYFFPEIQIVAIGAHPGTTAIQMASVLGQMVSAQKMTALGVGSTDLTHYGPNYSFVSRGLGEAGLKWVKEVNDPLVLTEFKNMNAPGVLQVAEQNQNACCPGAAAAAISFNKALGVTEGEILTYATSFDVYPEGQPTSFVGYASVVF